MEESSQDIRFKNKLWHISVTYSLILFMIVVGIWYQIETNYKPEPNQLSTPKHVDAYIARYKARYDPKINGEPTIVPTGVFIQAFHLLTPNEPVVTGYLWQKYKKKDIQNGINPGFSFPESTDASRDVIEPAYDIDDGDYRVLGWRFSGVTMYQQFDYRKYPFDRQVIWIRIWPKDFYKNVILVPDLNTYTNIKSDDNFGLERDIAVQEFQIKETFFDYSEELVMTNFGIPKFTPKGTATNLYFNISIQRKFINGFILYLMPILVVWGILFGLTMIMTSDKQLAHSFNFSTTGVLSTLGAVFFSILIAQINLRSQFAGHPITYIEYFYFLSYALIFVLALNAYLTTPGKRIPSILRWRKNLLPKILFWPVVATVILSVTVRTFYINKDLTQTSVVVPKQNLVEQQ